MAMYFMGKNNPLTKIVIGGKTYLFGASYSISSSGSISENHEVKDHDRTYNYLSVNDPQFKYTDLTGFGFGTMLDYSNTDPSYFHNRCTVYISMSCNGYLLDESGDSFSWNQSTGWVECQPNSFGSYSLDGTSLDVSKSSTGKNVWYTFGASLNMPNSLGGDYFAFGEQVNMRVKSGPAHGAHGGCPDGSTFNFSCSVLIEI